MTSDTQNGAPFLHVGSSVRQMLMWTLGALTLLIGLYSWAYAPRFFLKYMLVLGIGLAVEVVYGFLRNGRFEMRSGSSALTAGILVASIPPNMPMLPIFFAIVAALLLAKLPSHHRKLHFNPALVGRLFLMLAFHEPIVGWTRRGLDPDAVSTATPLELFHQEEAVYSVVRIFTGRVTDNFEEMLEMVPGAPGEMFTPLLILLAVFLFFKGVLDWRVGCSFVVSFIVAIAAFSSPGIINSLREEHDAAQLLPFIKQLEARVIFNLFSGAVIFSAVFIGGDPMTTPRSKGGRLLAGVVAGVMNASIRTFTENSEGIVYSFLTVNLLSPSLDRLCFHLRSKVLERRTRAFETTKPAI